MPNTDLKDNLQRMIGAFVLQNAELQTIANTLQERVTVLEAENKALNPPVPVPMPQFNGPKLVKREEWPTQLPQEQPFEPA